MQKIAHTAEYRYFSFCFTYFFGKACFGSVKSVGM